MRQLAFVWLLKALHAWDRLRLRWRMARTPGLEIHPKASSNFAAASFSLGPGARLRIGAEAQTDRIPGALRFELGPGAVVDVGPRAWLRTSAGPVQLVAFEGAVIELAERVFLNGAYLSAKSAVRLGTAAQVGMGSRVFDSDQHDLDADHPEVTAPVRLGAYVWVAADVTVLRGVHIGDHSVIGSRSLVNRDVPAHTFAAGIPAHPKGTVGDRTHTR
jgi:hypothetical protein